MAEVVGFFSAVLTLAGILYQVKKERNRNTQRNIEQFEEELRNFMNSVLGWYNEIISFSSEVTHNLEAEKITRRKRQDYEALLDRIKTKDEYYSKCNRFVDKVIDDYKLKKPFSEREIRKRLDEMRNTYRRFCGKVLWHKDKLGDLLRNWEDFSPEERRTTMEQIEADIKQIKAYKDAIIKILNVRLE